MGATRVAAMEAIQWTTRRPGGRNDMRRHGLTIVLLVILLVVLLTSLWLAWLEFHANEQHGVHVGHPDHIFWAYAAMQIGLNFVAEIMGFTMAVLLTKWFYEQGSAESQ